MITIHLLSIKNGIQIRLIKDGSGFVTRFRTNFNWICQKLNQTLLSK